jgi:hypothetical protein
MITIILNNNKTTESGAINQIYNNDIKKKS